MVRQIIQFFQQCEGYFFHQWVRTGNEIGDTRKCSQCDKEQVIVGHLQLDSDLGAIAQWENK